MLNSVEFNVITKKKDEFLYECAKGAHRIKKSNIVLFRDGMSVKVRKVFIRVIVYPRVYI